MKKKKNKKNAKNEQKEKLNVADVRLVLARGARN